MICILLESFLCDTVHPEPEGIRLLLVKDEYYCQQLLMHKQSLSKFGVLWCHVPQEQSNSPKKGGKDEFRAAHIESLL